MGYLWVLERGIWVLQPAGEAFKVESAVCSTPKLLVPRSVNGQPEGPHLP